MSGMAERLNETVTSAQLADALDSLGRRDQVMQAGIAPLTLGARAVGRAATVAFVPVDHDSDRPYDAAISFIDGLASGAMVVISSGGATSTAFWGELFSAAAIGRGAAGAVCDGYVRDSEKVRALGFPVFASGTRPIDFRARMEISVTDEPILCGGVQVHPGDLVLADDDGIVVVPRDVEDQATQVANQRAMRETTVLEELRDGATLDSVWNRYGVL
jgi:4-hydroxy-4-methyl-2-oxoglutarate aldolase